ncbi:sugar ABC transporter permease [Paenibacillus sp. GYB004]|uniref:carbohydrate ABC transporter permease n=1 Tax=Paenibacillus sp. GYB004 TaxID=2994393 RepID=UPI002F9633EE
MKVTDRIKLKDFTGLLYISPWIIGFLVFQFYPILSSFYYSFTDYSMARDPRWIGLKNYVDMFTIDPNFLLSLKVTIVYVLMAVPLKLMFALLVAVILNLKLKFVNFFRTVYYIPSILGGSVAIAILWRAMFLKDGLVNHILAFFHIPAVDWFGTTYMALFTLSLLTVWQFGSSMVLFLAGLKQIPQELYEAAGMDGASRLRTFFTITLPMLTPILFFNLVMQLIGALQEFTSAFVVTNGAPMKGTYLYGMKLYEEAFSNFKMGYASALSWVLFVLILVVTFLLFRSSKHWVHYEDGGR